MKKLIKKNLNGKHIFLLFTLTSILYVVMLTITIPKVMSFAGGMKLLDMMPTGYNVEYVNALLGALGEEGRDAYLFNQLPLDMIYPFFFGITYCLLFAFILNKLGKLGGNFFYFCFLPLFSGLFDYSENLGIIAMLNSYPDNPAMLTSVTNLFSILKSSSTTIYFVVLIVSLILLGKDKLLQKR